MLGRQAAAGDGDDVVDRRFVFLDGLIDSQRGADVLDHGTRVDRQRARRDLPADDRVDELFFTALRIAFLEGDDLDLRESLGRFRHRGDGGGLVLLDAHIATGNAEGFHHDGAADEDLLRTLPHDAVVAGQVRLALGTVENQAFGLLVLGRGEFHVGREGGAAQTDYAGLLDLLDDLFGGIGNLADDAVAPVDVFHPLIALDRDLDVRDHVAGDVGPRSDRLDGTGDRRMDISGNEAGRFGNHLAHLHLVAHRHDRRGRGAQMLCHRNVGGLDRREDLDRSFCGDLVVVRMDAADSKRFLHWAFLQFWVSEGN